MHKINIIKSNKLVEVTPIEPNYGTVEVHTNHIIAVNAEQHKIFFENVIWTLTEEDFEKVYEAWIINA